MPSLRSVASVLGSYALCVWLVALGTAPLGAAFPREFDDMMNTPLWLLLSGTAIFFVMSVVCAWLCARLAPARPGTHVLWFFALGELFGIFVIVAQVNDAPLWYSISWLVCWVPAVYVGWKLATRGARAAGGPS